MTKKSKKGKKKKLSANPNDAVHIHSAPTTHTAVSNEKRETEEKKTVAKEWAVGPLTAEEQKETRAVKAAYASFWENLKFKKGWDTPLFFQSEIDDMLDQAAEIVARIRVYLDATHPGFKMRMAEGNAHEFFWSQLEHPRVRPEAFVRELVHQTLKDANGYVEGLSKSEVDKYVDSVLAYHQHEDGSEVLRGEVQLLKAKAQRQFNGIRAVWDEAVEKPSAAVEGSVCTIVQLAAYRELTRALERVQYYVSIVQEEQAKERQEQGKHEQAAAHAKERFEEQSAKRQQLKAALHAQTTRAASPAKNAPSPAPTAAAEAKEAISSPKTKSREPSQSPSRASHVSQPDTTTRSSSQASEEDPDDPPAIKRIEELVKEVNVRKTELDRMKDRTQNLDLQELSNDPLRSQKTVKSLHERCKYLSLELERDLLKLDAIVGGSKVRPLRKAQVRNIQHMLEDVDSINEKLSGLETSLLPAVEEEQQRLAEQKAKEEAEAAAAKREEELRRQAEKQKLEEQAREKEAQREREREAQREAQRESLAERWKQLKLQPKFEIKELRNGYQVSAYIPGMRKEDLEISHSGNTLTLGGMRLPSKEEEAALAHALKTRGIAVDDQNLLRLGAGRFGRFQQQYSLPADVDSANVKATYEAGVFQVTIPRKPRPPPQRGHPGGGFFNDRDFWW